jgi:HSP20 family protein
MDRSGLNRLEYLRHDFERLLDELTGGPARRAHAVNDEDSQAVPINIFETETELVVVAAMPGIEPPNVDVDIDDTRLTVRGEKRGPGQERMRYLAREWSYGPYERTIDLPAGLDIDKANATYGNGVVTIAFPKAEARRRRRIEIKAADADKSGRGRAA